jgi:hypothetical protein
MIQFIITQDGNTENSAGLSTKTLIPSEIVHPIEVAVLWQSIKSGIFERDAKAMLEEYCAERGFNASELLS